MDPAKKTALTTEPGTSVLINGRTKSKNAHLITKKEYADMELHIEFLVPEKSNSGIYFMNRYEIQIFDSAAAGDKVKYSDCGGIYQRWDDTKPKGQQGFEGTAPLVNASLPPGEWQTFDIVFRAPRFDANGKKIRNARFVKVLLNGKLVQENVEVTGPTRAAQYKKGEEEEVPLGPLKLQGDHGPVAFRNILIRPVKLD
ncbi:MAG: DUF1080 domain-containing protein [Kiritimatiellales bacterium]|nr:DUF1080 domain-containing protein [Kiritimatiellales bacterium]